MSEEVITNVFWCSSFVVEMWSDCNMTQLQDVLVKSELNASQTGRNSC